MRLVQSSGHDLKWEWRRVPESNRSTRICNPLRNLSANSPYQALAGWPSGLATRLAAHPYFALSRFARPQPRFPCARGRAPCRSCPAEPWRRSSSVPLQRILGTPLILWPEPAHLEQRPVAGPDGGGLAESRDFRIRPRLAVAFFDVSAATPYVGVVIRSGEQPQALGVLHQDARNLAPGFPEPRSAA